MRTVIKGRNIELTPALKSYAEEKVSKITRHFDQVLGIEIELIVSRNRRIPESQTVEVTVVTRGPIVRARAANTDMYAAVDKVADKLDRQMKKYKEKTYHSAAKHRETLRTREAVVELEPERRIVRVKQFALKPMTPEEATLQMDLLGHDFFVFTNSDTEETNVVYRRQDDDYGLIEPSLEREA